MIPLLDRSIRKERRDNLRQNYFSSGFTLIELAIVVLIIGALGTIVAARTNTFSYWKEEGYIRNLTETINFLHYQAVVDQAIYRMEFDFETSSYVIGILRPEEENEELQELGSEVGNLSFELAAFLNPGVQGAATFIPPPSMPSLAKPVPPPEGIQFTEIRTMRGKETDGKPFIMFSPRGFSEFAVIHLLLSNGDPITVLVNPFTGLTSVIREYKDFTWTYGRDKKSES